MRIALIEVYPNKKLNKANAIDAHLRNAIIISDYLEADLLCVESDFIKAHKKQYDVLVLCFATHYAPFKMIKKLVSNNPDARKIVISNDVNFVSSIGGFRPYTLIAGYECKKQKNEIAAHTLNINLLLADHANELTKKKYDCIYYGTFRKDRQNYFTKYLQDDIYLSTSPKNFKKFKAIGCNPKYITKLSWRKQKETLNLFRYQLYIEDNLTNEVFCNLANRWYEAGICNNVVFFDANCRNTINKSELQNHADTVENYIVNSYEELQDKIKECNKDFDKHLAIQKAWRIGEQFRRKEMMKELKDIINGTK